MQGALRRSASERAQQDPQSELMGATLTQNSDISMALISDSPKYVHVSTTIIDHDAQRFA